MTERNNTPFGQIESQHNALEASGKMPLEEARRVMREIGATDIATSRPSGELWAQFGRALSTLATQALLDPDRQMRKIHQYGVTKEHVSVNVDFSANVAQLSLSQFSRDEDRDAFFQQAHPLTIFLFLVFSPAGFTAGTVPTKAICG